MLLMGSGILLAGCANGKFATLEGAGASFPQAEYQILGKTKFDQTWIDKTIEAEVVGFGFKRPAARPAGLGTATVVVTPATVEKPSIVSAIKKRFTRKPKAVAPTPVVAPPTPEPVPLPTPAPKKKHWWQRKPK